MDRTIVESPAPRIGATPPARSYRDMLACPRRRVGNYNWRTVDAKDLIAMAPLIDLLVDVLVCVLVSLLLLPGED